MALSKDDLSAIEGIVKKVASPIEKDIDQIKADIKKMQADLQLLATLNQIEEIRFHLFLMHRIP